MMEALGLSIEEQWYRINFDGGGFGAQLSFFLNIGLLKDDGGFGVIY
jgi:hypothetical protein